MKEQTEFDACAERLKALADPERLRIVTCLCEGSRTVGEIATLLESEIVNVSHHLAVLRRAKILLAKKEGRFVRYAIHPEVRLHEIRDQMKRINFGCCRIDLKT